MSVLQNIGKNLDKQFENFNFLPQRLQLEDFGMAIKELIEKQNFSLIMENGISRLVPVVYLAQELFAEKKMNWSNMRNENGEEILRPFIAISRTSVKKGTAPLRSTIPNKKRFSFVKVPKFDGTLKGFDLYKIPQPTWVDIEFEVRFLGHYAEDVDSFYEMILDKLYSSGQAYMKINGHDIASKMNDASEDNTLDDISSERNYQIVIPITVFAKLIDPTEFEKVNTITKISINITEK